MNFGHDGSTTGGPSKVVAFRRPQHPVARPLASNGAEAFPRFRREWNKPLPLPLLGRPDPRDSAR